MKRKIIYTLFAAIVICGISGCGQKDKKAGDTTELQTTEATVNEDVVENVELDGLSCAELPDYKNLKVSVNKAVVTDDMVNDYINNNMLTYITVTDRPIAEGDIAQIDYIGKKDGVAFDGGTAENYDLNIGSHTFINGFEDGLIGVSQGETVELNLTFPEEYQKKELAGADVVFTVTVKAIKTKTTFDEVTEEQLKEMAIGYDTKEALQKAAEEACKEQVESSKNVDIQNAIYETLLEETKFNSIPEDIVDKKIKEYNEYMGSICQQYYGCDLETYLTTYAQTTMEDYNADIKKMAEDSAKQDLIFDAIAKTENMEVSDDELNKEAEKIAADYQYESTEAFLQDAGKEKFRQQILQQKIMDMLQQNTTVEEVETEISTEK